MPRAPKPGTVQEGNRRSSSPNSSFRQSGTKESATLPPQGAIESSSERCSMARKRYQKGFIYLDGDKWKGRYREDVVTAERTKRIRREVILGSKSARCQNAWPSVECKLFSLQNQLSFDYRPGRVATFAEFVERWKARSAHEAATFLRPCCQIASYLLHHSPAHRYTPPRTVRS